MTEKAARALVSRRAAKLREAIHSLQAHETDPIVHHRLAEVNAECAWVERQYGTAKAKRKGAAK